MTHETPVQSFVTPERMARAVAYADQAAVVDTSLSAFDCAVLAVGAMFAPYLQDETGTIPVQRMAQYYRLVDDVEQRLGVHRARVWRGDYRSPAATLTQSLDGLAAP